MVNEGPIDPNPKQYSFHQVLKIEVFVLVWMDAEETMEEYVGSPKSWNKYHIHGLQFQRRLNSEVDGANQFYHRFWVHVVSVLLGEEATWKRVSDREERRKEDDVGYNEQEGDSS